jgi:hypothetical protein
LAMDKNELEEFAAFFFFSQKKTGADFPRL